MPSSLLEDAEERLPRRYAKSAQDVFVLVKAYVSDNDLAQKPLLAFPGCQLGDVEAALDKLARSDAPCSSTRNNVD